MAEAPVIFRDLWDLLRIPHWIKNLFVFAPAFFAFRFMEWPVMGRSLLAFFSFGFLASGVYVFNDLADLTSDREHPEKRFRPLASGRITPSRGMGWGLGALLAGGISALWLGLPAAAMGAFYVGMNLLYSWKLKHVPLLDICCLALGFVLRILFGGLGAQVPLSRWIVVMTFLLALFLALGKRRGDVLLEEEQGGGLRPSVRGYTTAFVDAAMMITAAVTLVAYLMYSLSPEVMRAFGSSHVYYSFVFVLFGMFRYLQNVLVFARSSPTKLLYQDRCLQGVILGWIGFFLLLFVKKMILAGA